MAQQTRERGGQLHSCHEAATCSWNVGGRRTAQMWRVASCLRVSVSGVVGWCAVSLDGEGSRGGHRLSSCGSGGCHRLHRIKHWRVGSGWHESGRRNDRRRRQRLNVRSEQPRQLRQVRYLLHSQKTAQLAGVARSVLVTHHSPHVNWRSRHTRHDGRRFRLTSHWRLLRRESSGELSGQSRGLQPERGSMWPQSRQRLLVRDQHFSITRYVTVRTARPNTQQ